MTEKDKRRNLPYNTPVEGLVIRYREASLTYVVARDSTDEIVGGPHNTRTEAVAYADSLRRKEG